MRDKVLQMSEHVYCHRKSSEENHSARMLLMKKYKLKVISTFMFLLSLLLGVCMLKHSIERGILSEFTTFSIHDTAQLKSYSVHWKIKTPERQSYDKKTLIYWIMCYCFWLLFFPKYTFIHSFNHSTIPTIHFTDHNRNIKHKYRYKLFISTLKKKD